MRKYRKSLLILSVLAIIALVYIHSRTPFWLEEGGDWSVGHGLSAESLPTVVPDRSKLITPKDLQKSDKNSKFLADPFFIKEKDSFYIFIEHRHFEPFKANLAVLGSSDGEHYQYKGTVLDEPFHLSYPQVFKHKGKFYMVPESAAAEKILLYSTEKFPYGWKVIDTLFAGGRLKDPSIYVSDSLNIMVASDDNLNMFLFKADSLRGQWRKVKRILRGSEARAGGRIFENKGDLILPVQDCARGYGSALSLYKFDFSGESPELVKLTDDYLKAQPHIPELAYGMHQFDIQKTDKGYYYVYDGNDVLKGKAKQSVYYALKLTFNDLLNVFR